MLYTIDTMRSIRVSRLREFLWEVLRNCYPQRQFSVPVTAFHQPNCQVNADAYSSPRTPGTHQLTFSLLEEIY